MLMASMIFILKNVFTTYLRFLFLFYYTFRSLRCCRHLFTPHFRENKNKSENKQETSEEVDEELLVLSAIVMPLKVKRRSWKRERRNGEETKGAQMRRRRKTIKVHATRSRSLLGTWS